MPDIQSIIRVNYYSTTAPGRVFDPYDCSKTKSTGAGNATKYCLQNRTTCRFFFPWPKMPHQQFDANMDRVACQRRCEEDDQEFVLVCGNRPASA